MNIKELQDWIKENCFTSKNQFNRFSIKKDSIPYSQITFFTSFLDNEAKVSQRCWHILNEIYTIPKCLHCNDPLKFKKFNIGYGMFCSWYCLKNSSYKNLKTKKTKLDRYGDENYNNMNQNKSTKLDRYGDEYYRNPEKAKQTNLEKYGVENVFQSEEIKEKIKNANLENYGVEYSAQREDVKSKIKNTNLKNYGVECSFQSEVVKEKIRQRNLEKYGVPYYTQTQEQLDKRKITKKRRYGNENYNNREQSEDTCLRRYNVRHISQSPLFYSRMHGGYQWHKYTLPSGEVIEIQGYEPKAFDVLLTKYDESEILFKRTMVPNIWYKWSYTGKIHKYYPDFYIPKDNLIVEVKSAWTYEKEILKNLDKQARVLELGYNYQLMIL